MPRAIARPTNPPYRPDALNPQVVDSRIADVEAVASWMDDGIRLPGGYRIGFDGIIGLIPGIGDFLGAVIALYIVWRATHFGVPRVTIARMLFNIAADALVGSIPVVGDAFDFAFKSNRMNVDLLKRHLAEPRRQRRQDWIFMSAMAIIMLAIAALPIVIVMMLLQRAM